jgi:transposase-like protein
MKRHSEQEMRRLYGQWLASGKSKADFASEQNIVPTTFYYWARKLGQQQPAPPPATGGFRLLDVPGSSGLSHTPPAARLTYPSGVWVDLYGPLDAGLLRALAQ